jgi:hypothetical protein
MRHRQEKQMFGVPAIGRPPTNGAADDARASTAAQIPNGSLHPRPTFGAKFKKNAAEKIALKR